MNKKITNSFLNDIFSQEFYRKILSKGKIKTVIDLVYSFGGSSLWFSNMNVNVVTFDTDVFRHEKCKQDKNIMVITLCMKILTREILMYVGCL